MQSAVSRRRDMILARSPYHSLTFVGHTSGHDAHGQDVETKQHESSRASSIIQTKVLHAIT